MTTAEFAKTRGVSRSTVARWCREGRLAATKVGRRWAIKAANSVIRATAKTVEAVAEIARPAEPRRSLWSYRRQLHGF